MAVDISTNIALAIIVFLVLIFSTVFYIIISLKRIKKDVRFIKKIIKNEIDKNDY